MSKLKRYNGIEWKTVNGQVTGDTFPIGAQIPYGSTTAPANWLVCDGSYVSKTTYSELYAVIGDSYLDGGTAPEGTFRLPNKKGRDSIGYDPNDTDFNTIGKTGGSKELQAHKHAFNYSNTLSGSDTTTAKIMPFYQIGSSILGTDTGGMLDAGTGNSGNIQPYQVDCWIIKAKQSSGLIANVSNTQSNSQTDTYSCDYSNDHFELKGTILYDNSTGTTGNVTLSETSANFTYLEIYYRNADNEYDMTKVVNPNGKRASLKSLHYYDNVIYTYMKCLDISGTSMNKNDTYSGGGYYGGAMGVQNNDIIYIMRVVGYK